VTPEERFLRAQLQSLQLEAVRFVLSGQEVPGELVSEIGQLGWFVRFEEIDA
jgi:hypothetical protein